MSSYAMYGAVEFVWFFFYRSHENITEMSRDQILYFNKHMDVLISCDDDPYMMS